MSTKTRKILVYSLIFLISFLWIYSLTYNFRYFWDDTLTINEYHSFLKNKEAYTPWETTLLFFDTIASSEQFYRLYYAWRPLQDDFIYHFIVAMFGLNQPINRIIKALLYASFITLSFSFVYRLKEEFSARLHGSGKLSFQWLSSMIPFLVVGYFLALPEFWIPMLLFTDTLILTLFFALIALYIFYFYYNDEKIQNKMYLLLLFCLILFFTDLSILTKNIGRINFALILVFLLFTERKKLVQFRYWSLILVLFLFSFPILGLLDVIQGESIFDILGISEHMSEGNGGEGASFVEYPLTIHKTFFPHAFFLFVALILFFFLHMYSLYSKKSAAEDASLESLKKMIIFSFFWYIFGTIILFVARGLNFDTGYIIRFELGIFLFPQLLLLISYCVYVYKKYFPEKKWMYYLLLLFFLFSIVHNVVRLNEWRGGWGAYFLGYDTARKYVDDHATNAVLIIPWDHSYALHFTSTNERIMLQPGDITNSSLLHSYKENYTAVFIADRDTLVFDDPTIVNIANLTVIDTSPYGILKKAIGKYYRSPFYLYEVQG